MLGHPTLANGLEDLTDHFQKQENLKDDLTLVRQGLAVTLPCVLLVQTGQRAYYQQSRQGYFFAQ